MRRNIDLPHANVFSAVKRCRSKGDVKLVNRQRNERENKCGIRNAN